MGYGTWILFIGLLLNAVVTAIGMWQITVHVQMVYRATNSMKDELVESVRMAAKASGIKQGRQEVLDELR